MIRLESVSVRKGRVDILREIDLHIRRGEITAIVGPSGAGKTTLLRVLNGLQPPDSGDVVALDLGSLRDRRVLRRHRGRTGTIFQDHALIDRLSAIDNVLLGLADRRFALSPLPWSSENNWRAARSLDAVGLLRLAAERATRLSGGERQRLGIARGLARSPDILLADEPFSSIDVLLQQGIGALLRRIVAERGMTLVIVLHQLDAAATLADRVIGLAQGRIVLDAAASCMNSIEFTRLFGVAPSASPQPFAENAPLALQET